MRKNASMLLTVACAGLFAASCGNAQKATGSAGTPSLKEVFKNEFVIGTALNADQIEGKDAGAAALVPQQFNAITPENIMKAEVIHPEWGRYDFDLADKLVAYGKKNN